MIGLTPGLMLPQMAVLGGRRPTLVFMAERYLPPGSEETARAEAERARRVSQELARGGTPVRYLGSTLVPSDETCFVLFEAGALDDVRLLAEQAGISYQRIVEAIQLGHEE